MPLLGSVLGAHAENRHSREDINACIESVCGSAKNNWSSQDVFAQGSKESFAFKRLWTKEFQPVVTEIARVESATRALKSERLRLAFNKEISLRPEQEGAVRALLGLGRALEILTQDLNALKKATRKLGKTNISIDEDSLDKLISEHPEFGPAIQVAYKKVIRPLIQTNILTNKLTDPVAVRLQVHYPDLNSQLALKTDAKKLLMQLSLAEKVLGEALTNSLLAPYHKDTLQKAKAGEPLTSYESSQYTELARSLDLTTLALNSRTQALLLKAAPSLTELLARLKQQSHIKALLSGHAEKDGASASKTLRTCKHRLSKNLAMTASSLRARKILETIQEVKASSKEVVKKFARGEQLKSIQRAIDNTEFYFPHTAKEVSEAFRLMLRERLLISRQKLSDMQITSPSTDARLILEMTPAFQFVAVDALGDKPGLLKDCENLPNRALTDFAITEENKVFASWYTLVFPQVGVGLLAHEIGHIVSRQLRSLDPPSKTFESSLTCVANRNPFLAHPSSFAGLENSRWSEEDWADHFSALVIEELQKSNSKWSGDIKNLACVFISDQGDQYRYNKLAPQRYDSHSSGFLRLLMTGVDRDNLPSLCTPFLDYAKNSGRHLRCE